LAFLTTKAFWGEKKSSRSASKERKGRSRPHKPGKTGLPLGSPQNKIVNTCETKKELYKEKKEVIAVEGGGMVVGVLLRIKKKRRGRQTESKGKMPNYFAW